MDQRISFVEAHDYRGSTLRHAVRRHLLELRAEEFLTPGKKVLLKPNLLMRRQPEEATTTHPKLVEAVVVCLQELGVTDITIADSPGGPYSRPLLEAVYKACGMSEVAQRTGCALNLETGYCAMDNLTPGALVRAMNIINPVHDADVVINLPKLKTHAMTTLSGAVKNLFGCVPGLQKPELHFRFPRREHFGQMLVELAEMVRPQLTIVDAVVAMEGDGPSGGTLRAAGWTLAGRNVHTMDLALCQLAGIDPQQVPTLVWAKSAGLLPEEVQLNFLGDELPELAPFVQPKSRQVNFAESLPGLLGNLGRRFSERVLAPRPVIHQGNCIGCGKCAESCPAHTIELTGGKAYIRYKDCIRCYCCHEMCPVRAIDIKRMGLLER